MAVFATAIRGTIAMTAINTHQKMVTAQRSWSITSGMSDARKNPKVVFDTLKISLNLVIFSVLIYAQFPPILLKASVLLGGTK